jgi:hypothetical protein
MVVRRVPKGRLPPLTFFFIIPLTLATWLAILVLMFCLVPYQEIRSMKSAIAAGISAWVTRSLMA